jgi:double-stranded uracil-DNA glycosylase
VDIPTIAAYEREARSWRDHRPARFLDRVDAFNAVVPSGAVVADLGCGAGLHLPFLRHREPPGVPPVGLVALDAALAMLGLVPEASPDAMRVSADLARLPFRRGALDAAWARASYLHLPRTSLPWALAELHHALDVGAVAHLTMLAGDTEGTWADDRIPGRLFARWQPAELRDRLVGAGFDVVELVVDRDEGDWLHALVRRARTLPDVVGPGMRLLVCGLNPSEFAADAGVGFARPGNRFWPAAIEAGLVTADRDAHHALLHHSIGMTDLVKRATPRADDLTRDEYRDGTARVERMVRWLDPAAVCFVGLGGYRAVVDRHARAGVQPEPFGGVPAYVMPNTSGLNARTSPAAFADHLRAAAALADEHRDRDAGS